jgi:type IV secretion system protein VirB2
MQSTKLPTWRSARHVLMTAGLMFGLSLALAEAAYAQEAFSRISTILQRIIDTINGPVGRSLAIIAVMMVGLAWMFGRMDVKQAGAVIVGIGVVFDAAQIVGVMAGG